MVNGIERKEHPNATHLQAYAFPISPYVPCCTTIPSVPHACVRGVFPFFSHFARRETFPLQAHFVGRSGLSVRTSLLNVPHVHIHTHTYSHRTWFRCGRLAFCSLNGHIHSPAHTSCRSRPLGWGSSLAHPANPLSFSRLRSLADPKRHAESAKRRKQTFLCADFNLSLFYYKIYTPKPPPSTNPFELPRVSTPPRTASNPHHPVLPCVQFASRMENQHRYRIASFCLAFRPMCRNLTEPIHPPRFPPSGCALSYQTCKYLISFCPTFPS